MNLDKTIDPVSVGIRGTGVVCALGSNVNHCMTNMSAGVRNFRFDTPFSDRHPLPYPVYCVPESFFSSPMDNKNLTLTSRMGLAAASQALENAKISKKELAYRRVGICMGTTVGCALNNDPFYIAYKQGKQPGMGAIKRFLNNNPAEVIAEHFNISGPVQTIVNACASGTDAIGVGASWIRAGVCDFVIAGGTDELCQVTFNGFVSLMITDTDPCSPFDRHRKGLNLGEGAAVMILEKSQGPSSGQCAVTGYGASCDAYHLTAPDPEGAGLSRALDQALKESGLTAEDIGFVNTHGTGTSDNDRVEEKILSRRLPGVPFFSTKGYTGHTLGAAGAIEAVFTIHHLLAGRIPQSIGFADKDPEMTSCPVSCQTEISCETAISQSVAFGGNNSVLVFSKR